jgi:hypothetical protein
MTKFVTSLTPPTPKIAPILLLRVMVAVVDALMTEMVVAALLALNNTVFVTSDDEKGSTSQPLKVWGTRVTLARKPMTAVLETGTTHEIRYVPGARLNIVLLV